MPGHSRLWMFGTNRKLAALELDGLRQEMLDFVTGWQTHGNSLQADFEILHQGILLVAVDESMEPPSGCSIDKVFQVLQLYQQKNQLDFFQRLLIWWLDKNELCIQTVSEVLSLVKSGEMKQDQKVFDMGHQNLQSFRNNPMIKLNESWMAKKIT